MTNPDEGHVLELQDYWQFLCRRRWWILGTLFVVWAVVWAASWLMPVKYRSVTTIMIEQQKVPKDYVESNVADDMQQRLNTIADQILSRARLQRIIDQFQLYPKGQKQLSPDDLVDNMRKDIEVELIPAATSQKQISAFRVYYSAPTPLLAQQVTGQLTSLFIQENQTQQQQLSASATQFLSAEVDQARQKVAECNTRLNEFKARYVGQLPSQAQGNIQLLAGLQSRYDGLMTSLNTAQSQRLYLESMLNQYGAVAPSAETDGDSAASIDAELLRLHGALDNARGQYSEIHPDVVALKAQIAEAEKRKQRIEKSAAENQKKTPKALSRADIQAMSPRMQVEGQLKANQQQIRDTQAQLRGLEPQIAALQHRLQLSPLREQELADLMREYDQASQHYDELTKKQADSQMATNMENQQQGMQFSILDAPNLPDKVHSPNRKKLSLAGLALGLALGIAIAFIIEKTRDRIFTEKDIANIRPQHLPPGFEVLSARVLVSLPHLPSPVEKRRKRRLRVFEWVAAVAMLIAIAAGNIVSIRSGYDSGERLRNVTIGNTN